MSIKVYIADAKHQVNNVSKEYKFDNELEDRVVEILDVRSDGSKDNVILVDGGTGA